METFQHLAVGYFSGLLGSVVLNFGIITLAYQIVWKKYKTRLKNRRIQLLERADWNQIKIELRNSFYTLMVNALFTGIIFYLSAKGYTKIYGHFREHSPFFAIFGFFILLVIDDTWFYWVHRLLHNPSIFRYIHVVHHKSVDVNPFTSLSFHWAEPFLLTLWIFPVALLIPTYAPVLGVVQIWGLLDNIKSHLGYELYPAGLNRSWLSFLTSSTYHNMHHTRFNGNYGVHFRFWDRLLKTSFHDYESQYQQIHQRKNVKQNNVKTGD